MKPRFKVSPYLIGLNNFDSLIFYLFHSYLLRFMNNTSGRVKKVRPNIKRKITFSHLNFSILIMVDKILNFLLL